MVSVKAILILVPYMSWALSTWKKGLLYHCYNRFGNLEMLIVFLDKEILTLQDHGWAVYTNFKTLVTTCD